MKANRPEGAPTPDEVLIAMREYMDTWNRSPTFQEMTEILNCGRSTVQRAVNKLEHDGWIMRRPYGTRSWKIRRIR